MKPKSHPCKHCGEPIAGKYGTRIFCSETCRKAHPREPWNKGDHRPRPNQRTGSEKQCVKCGRAFYVIKAMAEQKYCSPECYFAARWVDRKVIKSCPICNVEFESMLSEKRVTCSPECRATQIGRMHSGEKSHLWRGGKTAPYVGIWKEQRKLALKRDGSKCTKCGSDDRVQVHHIIPYRYSHSHDLDNLTSLCRSCHSKEELKVNLASVAGLESRWSQRC